MAWRFVDHGGRALMRVLGARARHRDGIHAYEVSGEGDLPPIVLLHGVGVSALSWINVVRRLRARSSRTLIPDLPGHGFSAARPEMVFEDVVERTWAFLDAELREPVVLVGNSLGGLMAVRYTLQRPSRVMGLVLVSPGGGTVEPGALERVKGFISVGTLAEATAMLRRLFYRPPWYLPLIAPYIRESYAKPAIRSIIQSAASRHTLTPEELGSIQVPTLLLWGHCERLLPPSDLHYFRTHLPPHARFHEEPDFGHASVLDQPERVADHIIRLAHETRRPP